LWASRTLMRLPGSKSMIPAGPGARAARQVRLREAEFLEHDRNGPVMMRGSRSGGPWIAHQDLFLLLGQLSDPPFGRARHVEQLAISRSISAQIARAVQAEFSWEKTRLTEDSESPSPSATRA